MQYLNVNVKTKIWNVGYIWTLRILAQHNLPLLISTWSCSGDKIITNSFLILFKQDIYISPATHADCFFCFVQIITETFSYWLFNADEEVLTI